jgi:tetratricopeptide (TPR) repeat protein
VAGVPVILIRYGADVSSSWSDRSVRPPPPPRSKSKKKQPTRRAATPPPIPGSAAPQGNQDGDDDAVATRPVEAPDAAAVVDEITTLVASEAEALLIGSSDESDAQLVDINVRLALMHWDVLEDVDASVRYLELSERHPLAPSLMVAHSISGSNPEYLETAGNAVTEATSEAFPGKGGVASALRDIAEAWLYRFSDPARAAQSARAGLAKRAKAKSGKTDRLADELYHVLAISLAAAEEWGELASVLSEAIEDATPSKSKKKDSFGVDDLRRIAEAAHLYRDRLDDSGATTELLARFAASVEGAGKPGDAVEAQLRGYLIECALEVAGDGGAIVRRSLLERRLDLATTVKDADMIAASTRYELAVELERAGNADGAAKLFAALSKSTKGPAAEWGPRLATIARARIAIGAGDWKAGAAALRELAENRGAGELAAAYERRAAELLEARVGDADSARDLWTRRFVADAADGQAMRAVERFLLAGAPGPLLVHLRDAAEHEANADSARRRAAAVSESRGDDLDGALELRTATVHGDDDVGGMFELARLYRRKHDRDAVARAYLALADKLKSARLQSALECAAGALELSRGRRDEAERSFKAAASHAPKDITARAALAHVYRRTQRWKDLASTLQQMAPLAAHEDTRLATLRELGDVTAQRLDDPKAAVVHFEAALAIDPEDPETLRKLADLYGKVKNWDKAVELRQRAADSDPDPARRVQVLMELGEIEVRNRRDDAAALRAYDAVLDIDDKNIAALQAVAQVHRRRKRHMELIDVLRRELELAEEPKRRLALLLEIATSAEHVDTESPIEAYLSALEIDPGNADALAGVEKLATQHRSWDVLAEAFRTAPRTAENLAVLSRALEQLGKNDELAEVYVAQIEFAPNDKEKSRLAVTAAALQENQLGDTDAAINLYQRGLALDPSSEPAQTALSRLLEGNQRWPELAATLEQELATVPAKDRQRQMVLLTRLGELRRDKLDKPGDAALAYESLLELAPKHLVALESLQSLYERLDRPKDLLRILEARAAAVEDASTKVELWTRIAEVKDKRDDIDGAVSAYRDAFAADPGSRQTFTAMEKLCYKHQRWTDAMALYDSAIELVENGDSRAYRLGDLYLRRGQVQLQYLGQPGEAAVSYLRVVELDPDNDTAIKFLESIFSQQGDWTGLIGAYETRSQLARDDEKRLESLRRAARVAGAKLKDSAEAARIYDAILAIDSSDKEALDALERFHERAGDWDKLVDVLHRRLESAPAGDTATALLRRIAQICEEGLRDESKAIENYLRILEIAPGNKDALEALGRIYESTEQWSEFIDVTRRQIRVTTDRNLKALLYFKCGSVMEAKFGKEEDAIRYYDAAIKTSPSCLPAVHGLRDLYRRREDWPRVIQTLELEVKLWQDDKERAGVFAQIGRIYADRLGQPERALHYFESALAVDPECLPANRALFDQYYRAGDWSRAQPLAQALAQKAMREGDPTQRSDFYLKRGIVSRMTGDMRAAAESIIIALEIKPVNLDALDALGDLAKVEPNAYDFPATYRELEKIYRKRDDSEPYMARVHVGRAVMAERQGDLDEAERLYADALGKAPGDFTILSALVDLHANMRRWTHACDAIVKYLESDPPPTDDIRVRALTRLAEIHDEGEMDAHKAASVLREVIRLDPQHQEAHYLLAQQMYLLGRYDEARTAIERVIELAAAPGADLRPENLARYYYYLGRIIEASGDKRSAASRYRRAAEYDPGYAPPALALAKRAVDANDQRGAETLLINAAHAAMETGGAEAAVPLQRGLARILLAAGERSASIEAYRGILAVEPDAAADRVALAEIYAMEDLPKAIQEVSRVVERDLRHAPAYRLLAQYYSQSGEADRGVRLLSIMDLLGYAEESDRGMLKQGRSQLSHTPLRGHMADDVRGQLLIPPKKSILSHLFNACSAEVTAVFPPPPMGENLSPVKAIDDPALKVAITDAQRLFGVEPEVYVGDNVPGALVAVAHPRRLVVIDSSLINENDAARRFLLGRSFEAIRGGYAMLLRLTERERLELGGLLRSLVLPESEQAGMTREFMQTVSKRALRVIERYRGQPIEEDVDNWVDAMVGAANRAGLFACDDFAAAASMLFRIAGENMALTSEGALALGALQGGEALVRFYLTDEYHQTRDALASPTAGASA